MEGKVVDYFYFSFICYGLDLVLWCVIYDEFVFDFYFYFYVFKLFGLDNLFFFFYCQFVNFEINGY